MNRLASVILVGLCLALSSQAHATFNIDVYDNVGQVGNANSPSNLFTNPDFTSVLSGAPTFSIQREQLFYVNNYTQGSPHLGQQVKDLFGGDDPEILGLNTSLAGNEFNSNHRASYITRTTGDFTAPTAGIYTLALYVDGQTSIALNGNTINVDNSIWTTNNLRFAVTTIALNAGINSFEVIQGNYQGDGGLGFGISNVAGDFTNSNNLSDFSPVTAAAVAVPEPGSLPVLALGLLMAGFRYRRRKERHTKLA